MKTSNDSPSGDGGIVYNITTKIEPQKEKDWIEWQKNENIPEVIATGLFSEYKFFHLLEQDETKGATYVIQYFAASMDHYKKFMDEFATLLSKKSFAKWNEELISFHTVMKIVH